MSPATRRILHLDVDAFLASVEQAVHPELAGKPVVVGGSPRSRNLVMSCSYEARALGLRPGMRLAEAARIVPDAVFRDGDSQAANRLREEVARILLEYTPRVEIASIDDFFVDLTGGTRLHGSAWKAALDMRAAIRSRAGLPVTVGIATSCTMARLAGKLAKPGGVAEIFPDGEEAFLARLPVGALPGVGHAIGRQLERFAIRTVGDLRVVPRAILFASFGRDGLVLYERARGIDERAVEATCALAADGSLVLRPPRSIRRETTFEPEEGRRELLEAMLSYLVERAAHRLRTHRCLAGTVEVRLSYVDTNPNGGRGDGDGGSDGSSYAKTRSVKPATDCTDALWREASALLRALPRRRALVKRLGVGLLNLAPANGWQGSLFSEPRCDRGLERGSGARGSHADRQRRLDDAVDALRERLGFGLVLRGTSTPLRATHPWTPDGFRLRTPSLNQ